jgi:hypothetical protein
MSAYAAFSKESRMKFASAKKFDRKSGGNPFHSIRCTLIGKRSKHIIIGPRTLGRTWGTRPVSDQIQTDYYGGT